MVNITKAVKVMNLLLDKKELFTDYGVDTQDRLGNTVLHYLAMCPIPEAVELFQKLVNLGAQYDLKDKDYNKPIHIAVKYRNVRFWS